MPPPPYPVYVGAGLAGYVTSTCGHAAGPPRCASGTLAGAVDLDVDPPFSGDDVKFYAQTTPAIRGKVCQTYAAGSPGGNGCIVEIQVDQQGIGWVPVGYVKYAHLNLSVSKDDIIVSGQKVGDTANVTGEHLHQAAWSLGSTATCEGDTINEWFNASQQLFKLQ